MKVKQKPAANVLYFKVEVNGPVKNTSFVQRNKQVCRRILLVVSRAPETSAS